MEPTVRSGMAVGGPLNGTVLHSARTNYSYVEWWDGATREYIYNFDDVEGVWRLREDTDNVA